MAPGDYLGSHSGVLVALPDENVFEEMGYLTWAGEGGARYGEVAGTSFAAPEVAGTAALIWAARPELKSYQVADIIKQSARREATDWTPEMGCGILDAGAALELATSRPASAWATAKKSDAAVCTAAGDEPPTWPSELSQRINFAPLSDRTFGEPDFAIKAKATSGLPLSFTAVGDCTVRGATVHLTAPGSCTITAAQPGNDQYNPAASVSRVFFIVAASRPMVHASLAPSGRWGAQVHLPFRVSAAKGWFSAKVTVESNGATISRLTRKLFTAEPVSAFALAWRAPKTKTMDTYRFCVVISDRTGATSKASCAFIRLR